MSTGGGHSTTTTTQELSKEQRALLAPVIPIAQNFLNNPPQMFPGTGIAGFSAAQQAAQDMMVQAAMGMSGMTGKLPAELQSILGRFTGIGNAAGSQRVAGQQQLAGQLGQMGDLARSINPQVQGQTQQTLNAMGDVTGGIQRVGENIDPRVQSQSADVARQVQQGVGTTAGQVQQGLGTTARQVAGGADATGRLVNRNAAGVQRGIAGQGASMISGAGGTQRMLNQQMRAGERDTSGLNFLTSGRVLQPGSNPALQGAINAATRPIVQNFREQVLPGITQESMGAGGLGGTRQGIAEGLAGRALGQTIGDISSSMSNQNYQAGLDAMTAGLNTAVGQEGQRLQATLGGGQLQQNAREAAMQGTLGAGGLAQTGALGAGQLAQTGALGVGELGQRGALGVGALQQGGALGAGQLTQSGTLGAAGLQNQVAQNVLQAMLGGGQLQQAGTLGAANIQENALGQMIQGGLGGQAAAQNWLAQQAGANTGRLNTLSQQGNILQGMGVPAQMVGAVGQQQQMMNQAQLSEQVQRFVNQQMIPFAAAQDVAALAFGMPGGTTKSQSTGGGNPMGGVQMGLGALSALPALFAKSERDAKEAVTLIEILPDGLGLYSFNYKGEKGERHVGLMAEEVGEIYPSAVAIDPEGWKRVNYLAIPTFVGRNWSN